MILNPFKCEGCKRELQPEDIQIGIDKAGDLERVCGFCFMGLMISGPIYAVIHEIYFNNGYSKVKPRDEIV